MMTLPHREAYLPSVHNSWTVDGPAKNYDLIVRHTVSTEEQRFNFDNYNDVSQINRAIPFMKRLGYSFYIEKARDAKPRESRKVESAVEYVSFETYDELQDNETVPRLIEFHSENRKVYRNTRGRHIKTRGHGRVSLTRDNPALVQFQWKRTKFGRILRAVDSQHIIR